MTSFTGFERALLNVDLADKSRDYESGFRRSLQRGIYFSASVADTEHTGRLVPLATDNGAADERARGRGPVVDAAAGVLPHHAGSRRQPRVLVVDDNRDAADSLAECLRLYELSVTVAYHGSDAMQLMEESCPDAVVLDIGMPRIDGLEVARWVRSRPWGRSVPLIALTAWSQPSDRERTAVAGFDRHLTKPVDSADLVAELRAMLAARPDKT